MLNININNFFIFKSNEDIKNIFSILSKLSNPDDYFPQIFSLMQQSSFTKLPAKQQIIYNKNFNNYIIQHYSKHPVTTEVTSILNTLFPNLTATQQSKIINKINTSNNLKIKSLTFNQQLVNALDNSEFVKFNHLINSKKNISNDTLSSRLIKSFFNLDKFHNNECFESFLNFLTKISYFNFRNIIDNNQFYSKLSPLQFNKIVTDFDSRLKSDKSITNKSYILSQFERSPLFVYHKNDFGYVFGEFFEYRFQNLNTQEKENTLLNHNFLFQTGKVKFNSPIMKSIQKNNIQIDFQFPLISYFEYFKILAIELNKQGYYEDFQITLIKEAITILQKNKMDLNIPQNNIATKNIKKI